MVEAVVTVKVAVCAVVPLRVTEVGATVQVDEGAVTAQLNATEPVKPPIGVTVMVEVLPVVAPAFTVMLPLLLRAKLVDPALDPVTTACTPAVWTILPVGSVAVISTL